jgi:hypothetical protein
MIPFQAGTSRIAAVDGQLCDRNTFLVEIRDHLL